MDIGTKSAEFFTVRSYACAHSVKSRPAEDVLK